MEALIPKSRPAQGIERRSCADPFAGAVVSVDPRSDPGWEALTLAGPSSVFHSAPWLRVLGKTYGLELNALIALKADGEPCAGLPFCRLSDMLGHRLVVLPFSDYCDPLAEERGDWTLLVEQLVRERCAIYLRCLTSDLPLADECFAVLKEAKWHGIDLRAELDQIWKGISDAAKRAIKKARQDGVQLRLARSEDELRAFFEMHLRLRKYKYRMLAQPYVFFENIWREFVGNGQGALLLALYQDEIIAGTFFLEWKDTLYYKFNASTADHLAYRPNDALIWEGIRYGKAKGYRQVDLGLSDWDETGLLRFKRKYASAEKSITFLAHGASDRHAEAKTLLLQMIRLFTDESVPDSVTARAGDLLYRYFA